MSAALSLEERGTREVERQRKAEVGRREQRPGVSAARTLEERGIREPGACAESRWAAGFVVSHERVEVEGAEEVEDRGVRGLREAAAVFARPPAATEKAAKSAWRTKKPRR